MADDFSGPEYTSTNFADLPHSDDWPDATTREPDLEPDEVSLAFLRDVEIRLNLRHGDPDVQQYVKENFGNG